MKSLEIKTKDPSVSLSQFSIEDSPHIFSLIDESRKHLSQNGDVTEGKYKTIEDVIETIKYPSNSKKLRLGIWKNKEFVGSINLTSDN